MQVVGKASDEGMTVSLWGKLQTVFLELFLGGSVAHSDAGVLETVLCIGHCLLRCGLKLLAINRCLVAFLIGDGGLIRLASELTSSESIFSLRSLLNT